MADVQLQFTAVLIEVQERRQDLKEEAENVRVFFPLMLISLPSCAQNNKHTQIKLPMTTGLRSLPEHKLGKQMDMQ